jgi:hypothetical protein
LKETSGSFIPGPCEKRKADCCLRQLLMSPQQIEHLAASCHISLWALELCVDHMTGHIRPVVSVPGFCSAFNLKSGPQIFLQAFRKPAHRSKTIGLYKEALQDVVMWQ